MECTLQADSVHFSAFSGCTECPNATRPGALDFSGSGASSTRAERPLIKVAAIRGGLKCFFNQLADSPKLMVSGSAVAKNNSNKSNNSKGGGLGAGALGRTKHVKRARASNC